MIDKLEKHHVGFVVPLDEKEKIEGRFKKPFVYDAIQQTHVLFNFDETLRIYVEYICKEGRAAKLPVGFAHVCYNVPDEKALKEIENHIVLNKLGYKITSLEKSGSKECGHIVFYYLKDQGVVEFNLLHKE